jgi:hypothetical protein
MPYKPKGNKTNKSILSKQEWKNVDKEISLTKCFLCVLGAVTNQGKYLCL